MLYVLKYRKENDDATSVVEKIVDVKPHESVYGVCSKIVNDLDPLPYGTNSKVAIEVYEASYQNEKLVAGNYIDIHNFHRRTLPMSEKEFDEKQQELLDRIPCHFHNFVSSYSYEHGHSGGHEEIVSYVKDLVYGIEDSLARQN